MARGHPHLATRRRLCDSGRGCRQDSSSGKSKHARSARKIMRVHETSSFHGRSAAARRKEKAAQALAESNSCS
jgi:hypothetical protein